MDTEKQRLRHRLRDREILRETNGKRQGETETETEKDRARETEVETD